MPEPAIKNIQFIKVADYTELYLNNKVNELLADDFVLFYTTETLIGMVKISEGSTDDLPPGMTLQ